MEKTEKLLKVSIGTILILIMVNLLVLGIIEGLYWYSLFSLVLNYLVMGALPLSLYSLLLVTDYNKKSIVRCRIVFILSSIAFISLYIYMVSENAWGVAYALLTSYLLNIVTFVFLIFFSVRFKTIGKVYIEMSSFSMLHLFLILKVIL